MLSVLLGACIPTLSPDGGGPTPSDDTSSAPVDTGRDAPVDDLDGDGYSTADGDCDDEDPSFNPLAPDGDCDGQDQDCDDRIDEDATWSVAEIEPNDLALDAETTQLTGDLEVAQALTELGGTCASGVIEGAIVFQQTDPHWEQADVDAFALTVATELGFEAKLTWDAPNDANLDIALFAADATPWMVGWDPDDVHPEQIELQSHGYTLQPGQTYHLVVLGWEGPASEYHYTLELGATEPGDATADDEPKD